MSMYTSGSISFTGLGSGTDFTTMIEGLIEVEKTHTKRLESWRATWDLKVEAFNALNTKLLSLKTTLEGMDSMNEFLTKNASSTDSTLLTATPDSDAAEGTHTIQINQLAQNKIMVNDNGFSAITDSVNSSGGSLILEYVYKGTNYQISVADGTTLDGLKNLINNDPNNPGVKAALVSDGTNHYLQLRGMDLGVDASLTIGAGTTLTNWDSTNWTTTQTNQNSQIKVNGWPTVAGSWISNASNTVTDAIEGLTLNLKDEGSSPPSEVTITVDTDNEAIKENIRTFVAQMNEVRSAIKQLTKVEDSSGNVSMSTDSSLTTKSNGSILTGNYGVEFISQNLKNMVSEKGLGFVYYDDATSSGDLFSALSQVGILTDAEEGSATYGLLKLDEDILDNALDAHPDLVAQLFSGEYIGGSDSGDLSYYSCVEGTTEAGIYEVEVTVSGGAVTSATINGNAATISGWEITGAAGTPEAGMVIQVDNHADGNYSADISLKLGKIPQLVDELERLTSSTDGPLKILKDNYNDIMDQIDEKIASEAVRLEKKERILKNKFARLEALLGQYEQINTQLSSSISQLSSD